MEDDELERSMFEDIGIEHSTAECLANCHLQRGKDLKVKGKVGIIKIAATSEWRKLPVVEKSSGKRVGGKWKELLLKYIKREKILCVWKFTRNFIKSGSRKKKAAYFSATAKCMFKSCSSKVTITQQQHTSSQLFMSFQGDVCHDVTQLKARTISGQERAKLKEKYKKNTSLTPGEIFRERLATIPAAAFAAGNRDGAGTSKVHQNIKAEAIKEINSFEVLHSLLTKLQEKLYKQDKENNKEKGLVFRKLFGFLQSIITTKQELKVIMFEEKSIRLFHNLAVKDIVYLDATGGVVKKMSPYEKIFLYAVALHHPFGKTFPVPAALYLTSVHHTESVRHLLMCMREKEKRICGNNAQPRLIVTDNSNVLQNACLLEFNGESRGEYLERMFRIINGSEEDSGKSFIFSCSPHILNQVKRYCIKTKLDNSQKHFAMRVIGRMICCETLACLAEIVKLFITVITAADVTVNVRKALDTLNSYINDFDPPEEQQPDGHLFFCDSEKEENDDDDEGPVKSSWMTCWGKDIYRITCNVDEKNAGNKYYTPTFFAYFRDTMLTEVALWTKMCFPVIRKDVKSSRGRDVTVSCNSNATVENFFKFTKSNKLTIKTPILEFVENLHVKTSNLCIEYINGVIDSFGKQTSPVINKCDINSFKALLQEESDCQETEDLLGSNSGEQQDTEQWHEKGKRKKKGKKYSSYLNPPPNKIRFSPFSRKNVRKKENKTTTRKSMERKLKYPSNILKEVPFLDWGGSVTLDGGKELKLTNTCTIDNFLFILACHYHMHPGSVELLKSNCLNDLLEVVNLLKSGCYDEAKYKWIQLNDETSYEGYNENNTCLNLLGTDKSLSYFPLRNTFRRQFSASCSSSECPGVSKEILHGTDLAGHESIEEALSMWESGYDKKCPAIFKEKPTKHNMFLQNESYGTRSNPITKYECVGKQHFNNLRFVSAPPVLIFVILEQFARKLKTLCGIDERIIVHSKHYALGGCTVFDREREHYVAHIWDQQTKEFLFYDGLNKKRKCYYTNDYSLNGRELSLLVYFLESGNEKGELDEVIVEDFKSYSYPSNSEVPCPSEPKFVESYNLRRRSRIKQRRPSDFVFDSYIDSDDEWDSDTAKAISLSLNTSERKIDKPDVTNEKAHALHNLTDKLMKKKQEEEDIFVDKNGVMSLASDGNATLYDEDEDIHST